MIGTNAFEDILAEYEKTRLESQHRLADKKAIIEKQIPRLKEIDDEIASLSVSNAISRIRGEEGRNDYKVRLNALVAERRFLLKENGFTEEDLEPEYICSLCKDTGYVNDKMCSCFKQKMADALYDSLNIKDVIKKENFEHFDFSLYSPEVQRGESESPLALAQKAVKTAITFIQNFDDSKDNLFITGDTGTGKTFLTNCIVKELIDKDHFVIYLSASKFFQLLSDATFNRMESGNEYITSHIYNCDLLVIDDLGAELTTAFSRSIFFACINERLMSGRHTIISTNLSFDKIQEVYSERVASRLANAYTYIKLSGEDIRIKKKKMEA